MTLSNPSGQLSYSQLAPANTGLASLNAPSSFSAEGDACASTPALRYIKDVRGAIADLRAVLTDPSPAPERIVGCVPALSEAAGRLNWIEGELRSSRENSPELSVALELLRQELRGVAKLIQHGAAFYRGWANVLGSAAAGYTPSGDAAPLNARGSVRIEA